MVLVIERYGNPFCLVLKILNFGGMYKSNKVGRKIKIKSL